MLNVWVQALSTTEIHDKNKKISYFDCCMYLLIDGCASVLLFLLMSVYIDALLLELTWPVGMQVTCNKNR